MTSIRKHTININSRSNKGVKPVVIDQYFIALKNDKLLSFNDVNRYITTLNNSYHTKKTD